MKYQILLWLFISMHAQSQVHERIIKPYDNTSLHSLIYSGNHFFGFVDSCDFFWNNQRVKYLYKLNEDLTTADSLNFTEWMNPNYQNLTDYYSGDNISYNPFDNLLYIFALESWIENNTTPKHIAQLLRFDTTLAFVDSITLYVDPLPSERRQYGKIEFLPDYFVYASNDADFTKGHITKFDMNLNRVFDTSYSAASILPAPINNKINFGELKRVNDKYILMQNQISPLIQYFILDTNFNILNSEMLVRQLNILEYGFHQIIRISGEDPLILTLVGQSFFPPNPPSYGILNNQHRYIGLIHLDSNLLFSQIDTFGYSWNKDWPLDSLTSAYQVINGKNYTVTNVDSLLFGATDIFRPEYFFEPRTSNTYLYFLNPQNSLLYWSKVYNNGNQHNLLHVEKLRNGNFLLLFNEIDLSLPDMNLQARLLIIDNQGNPIGLPEEEQFSEKPSFYPNPVAAGGLVNITGLQAGKTYNYYINATSGQTVQQGTMVDEPSINISQLPAGVYTLSITNKHGWGWATKLVVE